MIRKLLMGTVALAALSTTALAADLPSRRAPPVYVPPIPVFSWTGFYIGGQVGFGFGEDRISASVARLGTASAVQKPNGSLGGAHVGYNFAGIPGFGGFGPLGGIGGGGLVVGIEGDIDGTDYRDTFANVVSIRNQIQGSARGRVGIAVDRALFYATGGAAFAQFQTSYAVPATLGGFQQGSSTRIGWTVGGGVEYAITTQWSLRAEYRYADFDAFQDRVAVGAAGINVRHKEIMERAQVGFSYKFDTPLAPVVAKY